MRRSVKHDLEFPRSDLATVTMSYHHYDTDIILEVKSPVFSLRSDTGYYGPTSRDPRWESRIDYILGTLRARLISAMRLTTDRPRLTWGDLILAGDYDLVINHIGN